MKANPRPCCRHRVRRSGYNSFARQIDNGYDSGKAHDGLHSNAPLYNARDSVAWPAFLMQVENHTLVTAAAFGSQIERCKYRQDSVCAVFPHRCKKKMESLERIVGWVLLSLIFVCHGEAWLQLSCASHWEGSPKTFFMAALRSNLHAIQSPNLTILLLWYSTWSCYKNPSLVSGGDSLNPGYLCMK